MTACIASGCGEAYASHAQPGRYGHSESHRPVVEQVAADRDLVVAVVIFVGAMGLEGDGQKIVHNRILLMYWSNRRRCRSGSGRRGGAPGADVDAPCRHLGVFLLADEVELGGADVAVAGELAHLVHRGAVTDGVLDRHLAQAMDADAAAPRRDGSIPAASEYFLTSRHGILRSRCRRSSTRPLGLSGRKRGPSRSSLMPADPRRPGAAAPVVATTICRGELRISAVRPTSALRSPLSPHPEGVSRRRNTSW